MLCIDAGERPDFVTEADIERWEEKLVLLARAGSPSQKRLVQVMMLLSGSRELFYAGEWLGEQLIAQGVPQSEARQICVQHARDVFDGAQAWPEAQRIASGASALVQGAGS